MNGVTHASPVTAINSCIDVATTSLPIQEARRPRSLLTSHMQRVESMSYEQSRLWFMMEYLEDPTTYNCTTCYRLHGRVEVARLKQAVFSTGQRHGSLRTTFSSDPENGEGIQAVLDSPRFVWTHRSVLEDADVNREFLHLRSRVFDIRNGETMAISLLNRTDDRHFLLFGYHHIIMDGVSWQIVLRDIATYYQRKTPKPSLAPQYVDFSRIQREKVVTSEMQRKAK